ncbi:ABC transporter permease [Lacihabitans lacunae]|uniref:ABC transporter permease n=1 Tax=Lacihabitans lacunae TaxID=1028214 RepID=A0ABV7Z1V6_9BACT
MLLKIVWKNIFAKKLNSFLSILLMTFGIAVISLLINTTKQIQEKFSKNVSGIDMVIGAKGSPLQVILAGIYQIDSPTGNIPLDETMAIGRNPLIKEILPLSMGDNFKGLRITGCSPKYLNHFNAEFDNGHIFKDQLDVVLGASSAQKLNLKLNDTFVSAHGLDEEGEKHNENKYKVVGILKYNNSVLDNLILTDLSSIWLMHEEGHVDGEVEEHPKEITTALVKFRSPLGLLTIPRNINQNTKMQAALPSIEINRLFELMGIGMDVLKWLAYAIIIISGVSVFVTLYNALKERKYEMALMMTMGGKRSLLFLMLLLEGIFLSLSGFIFGMLFSRIGLFLISKSVSDTYHYSIDTMQIQTEEIFLLIAALLVGIFAALIPSIGIYKIDISKTLASE